MGIKVTKKDIVWNYLGTILSLSSNFIVLPIIVYFLDSELIGLWYVFLSIGGIVILFDFGFNPTLSRNVAYSWSGAKELIKKDVFKVEAQEPNIQLLKKVLRTCKLIYLIISTLALIVLLSIGTTYVLHISQGLDKISVFSAWFVYSISIFFSLYYGYYITFLRGVGAIREVNISTIISRVIQILTSITLLYLGLGLLAVAIANLAYGLVFRILCKKFFYNYDNIGMRLTEIDIEITNFEIISTFKIIWHNAWRDGFVSLSKYLTAQATVLIAPLYLTLTETGMYSISIQLITAIATISGALYTSYQPELQSLYVNNKMKKSNELMSLAMLVYVLVFWTGVFSFLWIGIPIINVIKSDFTIDRTVFVMVSIYQFLLNYHSYHASFISNTNNVPYVSSFVISSISGVFLSVILLATTNLGLRGLIFAKLIVKAVYNNWHWPKYVMDMLGTNLFFMFKAGIKQISYKVKSIRGYNGKN